MDDDLLLEPSDLALYMGVDEINEDRAEFLIAQVMLLAGAIVSPVPQGASPVILSAATRAYATPPGAASSELVGPYQATRPSGGIYLTKSERAALRLLTGGGGAFSFDMLPAGYPESVFADDE
jgi:hypothetical protein